VAADTRSAVNESLTPGLTWQPLLPPWQVRPSAAVTGPFLGPQWGDERLPGALWDRIRRAPSGCWLWKRETNSSSYASTVWRGRRELVHRLVWQALVGPIPLLSARPPAARDPRRELPQTWLRPPGKGAGGRTYHSPTRSPTTPHMGKESRCLTA